MGIVLDGTITEIQQHLERLPHRAEQQFRVVVEEATDTATKNGNGLSTLTDKEPDSDLEAIARQMAAESGAIVRVENGILTFGSPNPNFVLTMEMVKEIEDEMDEELIRDYLATRC